MSFVSALGYIVFRGPLEAWRTFGTDVLGLQLAASDDPDTLLFKNDERAWRIAVEAGEPAGPKSVVALGMEVRSPRDLDVLAGNLRSLGVDFREDEKLAARRGVRKLISFADVAGNTVEAYYGATQAKERFVSPRGLTFVAGDMGQGDFGVGHTFMFVADPAKTAKFYQDALGFRLSDTIDLGPQAAQFLHCNPRHHSMAFGAIPGVPPGIGHLMLEVTSLEDVGRTMDLVQKQGIPMRMSIGEHTNDRMTSFYVVTPSGFDIEYGFNGRVIDDDAWTVGHYDAASIWGHHFLAASPAPGA
ncbi:VOC family protein [Streptomyces ossamyceticus]|uniref:VOC family protein n=1 Tax=Streptomyces ossamyceticus TaxID=249581 RepID=UPI0006E2A9F4|nr:VOC family protein [Streptomyces ossamyceticus]